MSPFCSSLSVEINPFPNHHSPSSEISPPLTGITIGLSNDLHNIIWYEFKTPTIWTHVRIGMGTNEVLELLM